MLPPLGPPAEFTELGGPINVLWGSAPRELIARKGGDSVRARHLRQAGWLGGPRVKLHSIGQCLVRLARLRTEIQLSENFEERLIRTLVPQQAPSRSLPTAAILALLRFRQAPNSELHLDGTREDRLACDPPFEAHTDTTLINSKS